MRATYVADHRVGGQPHIAPDPLGAHFAAIRGPTVWATRPHVPTVPTGRRVHFITVHQAVAGPARDPRDGRVVLADPLEGLAEPAR